MLVAWYDRLKPSLDFDLTTLVVVNEQISRMPL